IKEYIQAALSPAEISQIQLDFDDRKANIIVADDQLSLAIGKHGQNVRLASQLVEWELNLFSFEQWKQLQEEGDSDEETEEEVSIADLSGVGDKAIAQLTEAGFDMLEKIAETSVEELSQIKGFGKVKAQKMIEEAKALLKG
ncbi:MAG: transcription termination/antitermination protein NusA, partial [Candidatus Omnitrophica bacterium]|nr:transcription termination/antitermination protein NusA [Candidatus Omnitrophota bacterium]